MKSPLKVCIGVSSLTGDSLGIGPMLVDGFSRLGHAATLVRDGDPAGLEADLLLLTRSAQTFRRYPEMLAARREARPATALWLLEPLPPPSLGGRAEQIGMRLARCDINRLSPPRRVLCRLIPWHTKIRDLRRARYTELLKRETATAARNEYGALTARELFNVMAEYAWFRERYSARWCDAVFAGTPPRCRFLQTRGIPTEFVPMGYHPDWGADLGLARDVDVLFLGRIEETSRHRLLTSVRRELAARGIELTVVGNGCFGDERTRLLNRARIVLDIPRLPWEMPLMRLLMCMSGGALVVSTWTGDPAPFRAGNLVQVPAEHLAETITWHLEHEETRRRIAEGARRFVTERLTLEQSLSTILSGVFASRKCRPAGGPLDL